MLEIYDFEEYVHGEIYAFDFSLIDDQVNFLLLDRHEYIHTESSGL